MFYRIPVSYTHLDVYKRQGYSMTANLKDMLTKTEALKYPYKRVNILYDSPRFTPVMLRCKIFLGMFHNDENKYQ